MVLEKTLESPLDCKEIQPVHSKGDQPWVFFGRNYAKVETPVRRDWGQEEKGKVGLKLNIKETKIMASSPITPRQIDVKTMETVTDFIFLGSKITANGDCSHEIKDACSLEEKL